MSRVSSFLALFLLSLLYSCSSGSDTSSTDATKATQNAAAPQIAQALPLLSISTENGAEIVSREDYLPARFTLKSEDGQVLLDGTTEIRGRGHDTWTIYPKKPYHMKLTNSSSLLGMPANKHWVLLANYSDKTLMRNDLVFQLSQWVGMEYTPRSKFVDVELNSVYQGIYQLTEHIRISPDRVNIPELKVGDTAPDRITGGYLLEIDELRDEVFCIDSAINILMTFCLKNPETLLEAGWEAQRAYIEEYLAQTEEALFSNNFKDPVLGYAAYIDVDSAVNWYLVNEIVKNPDADMQHSTFLFKKRNGKLTFGPVWDFDIAVGNNNFRNGDKTDGWFVRLAPWYARMFEDPIFSAKVKAKWAQLKATGRLDDLLKYIDKQALYLSKVQVKNFQTWDILSIWVQDNRVVTGSYTGEVAATRDWLRDRIAWMDGEFAK